MIYLFSLLLKVLCCCCGHTDSYGFIYIFVFKCCLIVCITQKTQKHLFSNLCEFVIIPNVCLYCMLHVDTFFCGVWYGEFEKAHCLALNPDLVLHSEIHPLMDNHFSCLLRHTQKALC